MLAQAISATNPTARRRIHEELGHLLTEQVVDRGLEADAPPGVVEGELTLEVGSTRDMSSCACSSVTPARNRPTDVVAAVAARCGLGRESGRHPGVGVRVGEEEQYFGITPMTV